MKRKAIGGIEQDAFTGWRKYLYWYPGELRKVKRKANKRERKTAKQRIANGTHDM